MSLRSGFFRSSGISFQPYCCRRASTSALERPWRSGAPPSRGAGGSPPPASSSIMAGPDAHSASGEQTRHSDKKVEPVPWDSSGLGAREGSLPLTPRLPLHQPRDFFTERDEVRAGGISRMRQVDREDLRDD